MTHFPLDTESLNLQRQYYFIDFEAKIAKYHCLAKYLTIYHYLENILQSTILLKLKFRKLKFDP